MEEEIKEEKAPKTGDEEKTQEPEKKAEPVAGVNPEKQNAKEQLKELNVQLQEAIEGGEKQKAKEIRKQAKKIKRKLRKGF